LDEWKWSEFDEFTWTNGMVAAFSLPTVWAEEMMTVDEFLNGKAQSGQKEKEFIEGNIFRLKIIKNPLLMWNDLPDVNKIFFWNLIKINYKDNFGTILI
jgi:hypothetical protein